MATDGPKVCVVCKVGVLYEHPAYPDTIRCFVCGYTEFISEQPNSWAINPKRDSE
jgi:hypothetical protein